MTNIAPPFFCPLPSLMAHNTNVNTTQPLTGMRVVSIAQNVPGPLAVARLVEKGAQAVKIEPLNGDPFIAMSPSWYEEMHVGVVVERLDLKGSGRTRLTELLSDATVRSLCSGQHCRGFGMYDTQLTSSIRRVIGRRSSAVRCLRVESRADRGCSLGARESGTSQSWR